MAGKRPKKFVDCSPANELRLRKHAVGLAELLLDYADRGEGFPLAPQMRSLLDHYLNATGFAARAAGDLLGHKLAIVANYVAIDGHADAPVVRANLDALGLLNRLAEVQGALATGRRGPKPNAMTLAWRVYCVLAAGTDAIPRVDENRRKGQAEFMARVASAFDPQAPRRILIKKRRKP